MLVLCVHAELKHRDERLLGAGGDIKTSASPFVDMEEDEDPEVLYDKVPFSLEEKGEGLTTRMHTPHLQGFTGQQMAMVDKNAVMLEEREKEIISIVQSISDINEMYRDLATLVVDQVSYSVSAVDS